MDMFSDKPLAMVYKLASGISNFSIKHDLNRRNNIETPAKFNLSSNHSFL